MRVLHAYNLHRNGGGADTATLDTIAMQRQHGVDVIEYARDSRTIPMSLRGKISSAVSPLLPGSALGEFAELLERTKPDVVHAHELYPLVGAWILPHCRQQKIPVVLTCYDYRMTCPVATHYRNGEVCLDCVTGSEASVVRNNCRGSLAESAAYGARSFVARKNRLFVDGVSRFIVLNDFTRYWLTEHLSIPDKRIDTVGCVVDLSKEPIQPHKGEFIAYAGRFAPEKGVAVLLEAMQYLDCKLKLLGYEADLPNVSLDNVEVVRTQSKEELHSLYRKAKMLVVPSLWFETFGIVAAEAMSHGVPVVASAIGALQYTVSDGYNGLHFEAGNAKDLARKVRCLLDNPAQLDTLGRQAYATVEAQYTKEVVFQRLVDSYEKAIAGG